MKTVVIFRRLTLVLVFFTAILPVVIVRAQDPTPSDDEVNAIARKLYCPVCENTPLDVCPTTACHQWRELIRQMIAEGKSESEIEEYFVANYGARVLSEPPASGINWLVYVVPPVAFVLGVGLLFQGFRIWKRSSKQMVQKGSIDQDQNENPKPGTETSKDTDKEYISRLEKELRERN